ncbi:MAG: VWA domain-containing protein [Rhizobiaceae bacterium]
MKMRKCLNLAAAGALWAAMSFTAAAAERSIIVLDASGSMWGQIGQKAKIEIARETLGDVLSTVPAESELGLMVYGHREKGSCKDIELAVPPAKGTADAISKFAGLIKPKGKTPLSASVKQAAEALRYTEDKATVILVTDGLETCDADPCALGRELENSGVDFTAHVVGFGLSDEDGKQVACLAEETGGKYLKAEDAGALGDALTATVVEAAAEPEPEPAPEPARPEFNVVVSAHLSEGGPVIEKDGSVRWDFYPIADNGSVSKKSQGGAYGAERKINLDAGAYKMRTKLGKIVLEREIEVSDTEAYEDEVVFNAGILTVTPKRTAEDTEAEKNARVDVKFGSLKDGTYGKAPLYVAAGEVLITGKIGKAVVEETITVAAGEMIDRDLVIAAGVVIPSAVYSEGGPAVETNEIRFTIQTAKQDLSGKRKNINGKYGAGGTIDVPAGEVVMHARLGRVEVISEPFSVKGGEATEASLNLNAGVLAVTAPDTNRYQILSAKKDINGKRKRIGQGSGAEWQETLPAGEYVVEVFNRETKEKRQAEVSVPAGERTEITIEQ